MDVEVRDERGRFVEMIQNVSNVIDARDDFAIRKGFDSWGDMVASFRNNTGQKPPYYFYKK